MLRLQVCPEREPKVMRTASGQCRLGEWPAIRRLGQIKGTDQAHTEGPRPHWARTCALLPRASLLEPEHGLYRPLGAIVYCFRRTETADRKTATGIETWLPLGIVSMML
jgi:hypothetical protein